METLQRAYSAFDPDSDTDYSKDETFLRITWSIRDQLSPEAVEHIFSDYQSSQEAMGSVLRQAEKAFEIIWSESYYGGPGFLPERLSERI
ncbi:hypothetical protein QW131_25685 [Roseibium salinum]|nr:hypothetical protein [Roseibium salinum]